MQFLTFSCISDKPHFSVLSQSPDNLTSILNTYSVIPSPEYSTLIMNPVLRTMECWGYLMGWWKQRIPLTLGELCRVPPPPLAQRAELICPRWQREFIRWAPLNWIMMGKSKRLLPLSVRLTPPYNWWQFQLKHPCRSWSSRTSAKPAKWVVSAAAGLGREQRTVTSWLTLRLMGRAYLPQPPAPPEVILAPNTLLGSPRLFNTSWRKS